MDKLDILAIRFFAGLQLLLWLGFLVMLIWTHKTNAMLGGVALVLMNVFILCLTTSKR